MYLIVGLGKTGHSIAHYLRRKHADFVVFDTRLQPSGVEEFKREFPEIKLFLGSLPTEIFTKLTAVITSPGVPLNVPAIKMAQERQIPIFGDIECLAREIKAPVVAITGTNGKSTVTTLVGEMARVAGRCVAVAGNIGLPVLDFLDDGQVYDLWVLELSSFQLELTHTLAPLAATILNITPDHLDRHHTLEAYMQAKQRIYHRAAYKLYNRGDELSKPSDPTGTLLTFGLDEPATGQWGVRYEKEMAYLCYGQMNILSVDALRIKGRHNWANALAASALAYAAGIPLEAITQVLQNFSGLPHRSQWVRSLEGVDWINDSKGTNVGATISAIAGIGASMQGKIVLIAGGQAKGADFQDLRTAVSDYVRAVVLMGEDADKIELAIHDLVPVLRVASLEDAVNCARTQAHSGDVVLLSPACASFDMFRDFNHRGEHFTAVVDAL